MYIHERDNWTSFRWDTANLTAILEEVNRKQGMLYGRLSSLGFDSKVKAMAENKRVKCERKNHLILRC